jgi:hypothetical protein
MVWDRRPKSSFCIWIFNICWKYFPIKFSYWLHQENWIILEKHLEFLVCQEVPNWLEE